MKSVAFLLLLTVASCVPLIPRGQSMEKVYVGPNTDAFKRALAALSQDGFTIEVAQIDAGVLNTGWKTFSVVRGLAKVSSPVLSKVQIVFVGDSADVRVTLRCRYATGLYSVPEFMDCYESDEAVPALMAEEKRLLKLVRAALKSTATQ